MSSMLKAIEHACALHEDVRFSEKKCNHQGPLRKGRHSVWSLGWLLDRNIRTCELRSWAVPRILCRKLSLIALHAISQFSWVVELYRQLYMSNVHHIILAASFSLSWIRYCGKVMRWELALKSVFCLRVQVVCRPIACLVEKASRPAYSVPFSLRLYLLQAVIWPKHAFKAWRVTMWDVAA